MKTVTVLTPTVGSPKLLDAVTSVGNQTYQKLVHHLVIDGAENADKVHRVINSSSTVSYTIDCLTNNVGGKGFYGHRIYAAFGHLINTDYICFLDEDNWFEPNHVETLVETLEKNPTWQFAHSLRQIHLPTKEYVCDDNCESLGAWPTWVSLHNNAQPEYLVDTSSYCFRRETLVQSGHLWHSGWGGDRRYLAIVRNNNYKYGTSGKYTLNYRLDGNQGSVSSNFFMTGNHYMQQRYNGDFPWNK